MHQFKRSATVVALAFAALALSCHTPPDAGPEAGAPPRSSDSALRAPSSALLEADLLIVGGNESACAAALQAARLGVKRIVLVNDIAWLGGQFSAEGVGCLDEWTMYRGKRVNFPRSGIFLEIVQRIRQRNAQKFGLTNPGNAWCGTGTIEPAEAAKIFEELLAPFGERGTRQVQILRGWEPVEVDVQGNRVAGVTFKRSAAARAERRSPDRHVDATGNSPNWSSALRVRARLTIDSSDWGDVIRLSGAKYSAGPDLKSRFNEPSAPVGPLGDEENEMNPLSWCVTLRETGGRVATITPPDDYDPRKFAELDRTPPWVDWDGIDGIYAKSGWCVYTHRRLVDRRHNGLPVGTEKTFLNWPVQDYPLFNFPKRVVDALEATEPGASRKNIVAMTPAQRRIVFEDAKRHTLGMLYHLQTMVHDRVGDFPQSFRYMELTDEFGTPDRLPPKPYIREGLRLEALYMLREQDIRAAGRDPHWAKFMPPDAVLGFQFNIDFHPTRRKFLDAPNELRSSRGNETPSNPAEVSLVTSTATGHRETANTGPWVYVHTPGRNWHTDTDRAMLPLRSLVPIERDGLLGASKNIGVSSLVSAAVRVHAHTTLIGQATGTAAWLCLRDKIEPRELARDWSRIRELQLRLVRGVNGAPGVLLWPYHDLAPDDVSFEAVNMLSVQRILEADADSLDFQPFKMVTLGELRDTLQRAARSRGRESAPFDSEVDQRRLTSAATWKDLAAGLRQLGLKPRTNLEKDGQQPLNLQELARILWAHVKGLPERIPQAGL